MKYTELIESVTFGISKLEPYDGDHPDFKGKMMYNDSFAKEVDAQCWVCDGSGKDKWDNTRCDYCHGSGKIKDYKRPFEELNVSNSNAYAILDMIGLPSDEAVGAIAGDDLAKVRRKLIKLKNQDLGGYTDEPSDTRGQARAVRGDDGLTHIKTGPRMIYGGRSTDQVMRYIDSLLELIDFAQKNDGVLTWS